MKNIKIKICGIKKTAIVDCCHQLKVDYFGMVFYEKSPRNINIKEAINLINYKKNTNSIPVGVFVNHDFPSLSKLIKKVNLKYIQLHGEESNDYIEQLKEKHNVKIIKKIGIQNENDLQLINLFSKTDYFLFDYKAKKNELPGGNAKSFNWSILKHININKPWFISGGINIYNIKNILENLIPYGIDISSGVEDEPGIKNVNKIKKIVKLVYG